MSQMLPIGIRLDEKLCENPLHEGENPPVLTRVERDTGWAFKEPEFKEWCPRCWRKISDGYYKSMITKQPFLESELLSAKDITRIKQLRMLGQSTKFFRLMGISTKTKTIEYLLQNQEDEYTIGNIAKSKRIGKDLLRDTLRDLVSLDMLTFRMCGDIPYFKLNKENVITKSLLDLFGVL